MAFEFFDKAEESMEKLKNTQGGNIHNAALLILLNLFAAAGFFRHLEADTLMRVPLKYAAAPAV